MRNYMLKAFVLAVIYMLLFAALDVVFSEPQSFGHYLIGAILFAIFLTGFNYLEANGWNSWKRIGSIFKKKDRKI